MDKHRGRGGDGDAQAAPAVAGAKSKARAKAPNKRTSSLAPTGSSQSVRIQGNCYLFNRFFMKMAHLGVTLVTIASGNAKTC